LHQFAGRFTHKNSFCSGSAIVERTGAKKLRNYFEAVTYTDFLGVSLNIKEKLRLSRAWQGASFLFFDTFTCFSCRLADAGGRFAYN